jgi:hypothetical protein
MKLIVNQPQAGPSGSTPEEGIVIISNAGSLNVNALKWGKDVEKKNGDIDYSEPM